MTFEQLKGMLNEEQREELNEVDPIDLQSIGQLKDIEIYKNTYVYALKVKDEILTVHHYGEGKETVDFSNLNDKFLYIEVNSDGNTEEYMVDLETNKFVIARPINMYGQFEKDLKAKAKNDLIDFEEWLLETEWCGEPVLEKVYDDGKIQIFGDDLMFCVYKRDKLVYWSFYYKDGYDRIEFSQSDNLLIMNKVGEYDYSVEIFDLKTEKELELKELPIIQS